MVVPPLRADPHAQLAIGEGWREKGREGEGRRRNKCNAAAAAAAFK